MDFTLVNYKLKPFFKLLYEAASVYMIGTLGYPALLIPPTEEEDLLYEFCSRWVLDKQRLLLLKVSEDGEVLRAYNGYTRVSSEELTIIYGSNP